MKKLVLFLFLLSSTLSFGQASIRGTILDSKGDGLPFVNVILFNSADSSLIKGEISNLEGQFTMRPPSTGNFYLKLQLIGMKTQFIYDLNYQGKILDLGKIVMQEDNSVLEEVQVQAEKPMIQAEAGKTIFNIDANLSAGSGSAQELLRAAPGLFVDQNDNLILEGRSGVQVFVDGRPLNLQGDDLNAYLKNLQSDQIEKVEIISQPGSQYDAAGNAGIINIVLKRDKSLGTTGSYSHRYTQGYYPRNNGNLNLYHNRKAVRLLASVGYGLNQSRNFMDLYRRQNNIDFDQRSFVHSDRKAYNTRLGADWRISKEHSLGFSVKGDLSNNDELSSSRTPIIPDSSSTSTQVLLSKGSTENESYSLFSNVYYRWKNDKNQFGIDLDQGRFSAQSATDQPNRYVNDSEELLLSSRHYQMATDREFDLYSAKADYSRNLGAWNINSGFKWSEVRTANDFNFYLLDSVRIQDPNRSNLFDYREAISAGYIETSRDWQNWGLQAGLRYEHTTSKGQLYTLDASGDSLVQRDYGNWFPSLSLSYKKNPLSQWTLSYSRRIQRPNYQNLNPFLYQRDELTFYQGNPFLIPQISDNIRIGHLYRYSTSTSVSYSYTQNFFAQITDTVGEKRSSLTTRNVADTRSLSLSFGSPFKHSKWWNSYVSVNTFQTWYIPRDISFQAVDLLTVSLYGQTNFNLGDNWQWQISGWWSSPSLWGGTYRTKSLGAVNTSISKSFMNDKLKVFVNFNDVFFSSPWYGRMSYGGLSISGTGGHDSRQIEVGISYRFGNEQVKKLKLDEGGLEDESKRVN
ncbi:TonB-dependent receptor domain-containing protein [Croceimicrobium hydrocarbonivorans]|uniref:TonB-dependent receptor n=1 Tax=Croceimicrobium hydrocarbonivorans TaxID=2761580 RepID=A0A7H0VHS9_9FLAO|nr:TonB-dependent receptor [Croceimicrobium hydrocarbonivorans]QNR25277.1 TonB-dependent receptor [Croceimicrobium hydrocarbonivorans]